MKKIAVLTSGGDAPGMNAAIRSVVRSALHHGIQVMGINEGYKGLLNNDMFEMNYRSVSDCLSKGGTILKTARCRRFATPEGVRQAVEIAKENGIEGLVVIGGDGSFKGARDLSHAGLPTIGIPGTIDNDISCTDYTIGFDTAMNTACECIDKLRDTCSSHNRCSVVEVMGRRAGHIALEVAIANGAEAVILPEKSFDFKTDIVDNIKNCMNKGKSHFVVIIAEGIGNSEKIAAQIEAVTEIETRATVLGHLQRGGSPTVYDRVMASRMGVKAVELLLNDIGNRVVAFKDNKIVDYDITEALEMAKTIDEELFNIFGEITY